MQIIVVQDALQLVEKMSAVVAVLQNVELHVLQIAQGNVLVIALVLVKILLLPVEQAAQVIAQKIVHQAVLVDVKAYVLLDAPTLVVETAVELAAVLAEQVVPMNVAKVALDSVPLVAASLVL